MAQDSEHEEGNNSEDEDNACGECKKEQFFYVVFYAEEFLDSEYRKKMDEFVEDIMVTTMRIQMIYLTI